VSRGRVGVRGGGGRCGTTGGVGEDNYAGGGGNAQDGRRQGGRRRWSPGRGGGRHGGSRAPEAGEDGAEEQDDTVAAESRRPGRPVQVGEEVARVPRADGGGPATWWGARASADFGRPAAAENPVGERTGGAAEGGSRGG
jgi:hypothetical protein